MTRLSGPDQEAVDRVTAQLTGTGRLGVAFSGGVDSSVLLALAARAPADHAALRPPAGAGLGKAAGGRTARALALRCGDKRAAPCLASRIPHFEGVVPAKLRQVEQAEAALRRLGFEDSRVRHHGDV